MPAEAANGGSSTVAVMQRILGNLETIGRAELRLLKAELLKDAGNIGSASVLLAAGAAVSQLAFGCLLLGVIYLLGTRFPPWLAAMLVGVICGAAGVALLVLGRHRLARLAGERERAFHATSQEPTWVTIPHN